MAFLDETGLAELWSLIRAEDEKLAAVDVKIATGSYTGTGKYGSGNKNSLSFNFDPLVVIVQGTTESSKSFCVMLKDVVQCDCHIGTNIFVQKVTHGTKYLEWYCSSGSGTTGGLSASANGQMNASGGTYKWIAIG